MTPKTYTKQYMKDVQKIIKVHNYCTEYFITKLIFCVKTLNMDLDWCKNREGLKVRDVNKFEVTQPSTHKTKTLFKGTFNQCADYVLDQFYKQKYSNKKNAK